MRGDISAHEHEVDNGNREANTQSQLRFSRMFMCVSMNCMKIIRT